jgi:hypothetical protein
MKTILTLLSLSALALPLSAGACKIFLQEPGEAPAVHAETVLVVEYHQSHRNCPLTLSTIQVKAEGLTILSATSWEETGTRTFLRKFKVRIDAPDCALNIKRECPKGGLDEKLVVKTRE